MSVTLDDLRVFVAVCDAGNLSAVARQQSCSQSAVSQHVRRLERETGLALVERRPRGVAPTPAGRVLYRAAADGLGGLDRALRQLDGLRRGEGGTVRITSGGTAVRRFMAGGVVAFRRRHPDVTLEFRSSSSNRRSLEAVLADRADLAWVTVGAPVRGIEQHPVVDMPWLLVVRDDDPLAARTRVTARDLASLRYISLPEQATSQAQLTASLAADGVRLSGTTTVGDWDTALLLVELGFGHAVVPALPALPEVAGDGANADLRAIPVDGLAPLAVGWAARDWSALTPVVAEFAATVVTELTGTQGVPSPVPSPVAPPVPEGHGQ